MSLRLGMGLGGLRQGSGGMCLRKVVGDRRGNGIGGSGSATGIGGGLRVRAGIGRQDHRYHAVEGTGLLVKLLRIVDMGFILLNLPILVKDQHGDLLYAVAGDQAAVVVAELARSLTDLHLDVAIALILGSILPVERNLNGTVSANLGLAEFLS